uniref:Carn_acyltransf domain-containing protein n=1 Tax=Meloidogyne hapla TaxID=6305 RepID=A0A1I8BY52_MELHA
MTISQLYKKVLSFSYKFKPMPCSTSSPSLISPLNHIRNNVTIPNIPKNNNLPKLPIPQVEHTIEKFLKFSKAILGNEDYGETLIVANKFIESNEAKQLQKKLEERAQKLPNWLTPWWLDIAYLTARTPLPVITSPGVTFPYFKFNGIEGQIDYAAKIIQSALLFHHKILTNDLTPDKGHGHVLFDMEQYKLLFGTTRIPKLKMDKILYGKDQKEWAKHILVVREGNIFKVSVYDNSNKILSIDKLKNQLKGIIENVDTPNTEAINIVSSTDRDTWASVYERIKENNPNEIKILEDSLFLMSLDKEYDKIIKRPEDKNMEMALHGGGAKENSRNRWFDKTLQFYVNENGYGGITYEHTPAEGPPLARLLDFICDQLDANTFEFVSNDPIQHFQRVNFRLELEDGVEIKKAEDNLERVVQNLEVKSLAFNNYGKNVPKRSQLSPDSWIQLALQIAHFRMHIVHPPAYETGTLRKFLEGRTDTIRLPTTESVTFVEAISARPRRMSDNVILTLLEAAVDKHKKYSLEVMNGNGIDRHLLGLKLAALENGQQIPQLFNSKGYQKLMHFKLSTSQVPTKHVLPMGFGPSAADCYGVCYNPQEHKIFFTITAFNECKETSAERFSKELEVALLDMRDLVERTGRLKENAKL